MRDFFISNHFPNQERSSSQRKELFKKVQRNSNLNPVQLLLDMKVRWGSTHVMLKHALSRQKVRQAHFLLYKSFNNSLQVG
jgi:hypothetical protein